MGNLKNDLEGLDTRLISRAMKTVLYILPVMLLAHKLYVKLAGNNAIMHVGFDMEKIISNMDFKSALYSFVFFMLLFLLCYSLETLWIPVLITAMYNKKFTNPVAYLGIEKAESMLEKKDGFNSLRYIHIFSKGVIIQHFSSLLLMVSLWMIYINNFISYAFLASMIYLFFNIMKGMNTFYDYYPAKNLSELESITSTKISPTNDNA